MKFLRALGDILNGMLISTLNKKIAAPIVWAAIVTLVFICIPRKLEIGFFSPQRLKPIVFGLIVSAFTGFFVEAFPVFIDWVIDRYTQYGRFLRFFGEVTKETRGAVIIFSDRSLSKGAIVTSLPQTHGNVPDDINAEAEGITNWIPGQDLRGANYVAGELAKIVKQTAYYRTDADIRNDPLDQIRATIFSFGLGFNQFTYRITTSTSNGLFKVDFSPSPREQNLKTDNIDITGYGILEPKGSVDCAIVARIVHTSPKGSPSRYFFVCAGRTATGTAVAGRYLANNWNELFKLYQKQRRDLKKDSLLVVVSHKYDLRNGEDDLGDIATDHDGKALVRWWSAVPEKIESRDNASVSTVSSSLSD